MRSGIIFAAVVTLGSAGLGADLAHSQQPRDLLAEDGVRVDDMIVRRVRDGSNGVVCYVASSYAYAVAPKGRTIAISCIKEKP